MIELTLAQKIAIWALPLIFAITLHEVAHGYVANFFGDKTAKLAGRLSLNPLKHIDWLGTVILPLLMFIVSPFVFGWAKPVPVDPRNFKNLRRDMALVALAGPAANLLMAIMWAGLAKLGYDLSQHSDTWFGTPLYLMGQSGIIINVVLAVLNFIPLPPLDGAKILGNILPRKVGYYLYLIEPYSFPILIILIITGALSYIMMPPVFFLYKTISSWFGLA
jgi:Zn-dependent protease